MRLRRGVFANLAALAPPTVLSGTSLWNAADKNAGITLSNGGLTAAGPGSVAYRGVRGDHGLAPDTGKFAFTCTVDVYSVEFDIGVANASFSLSADGRTAAEATVLDDGGNIYYTNNYGVYIGSNIRTPGDVIMVAIDTAAGVRKAWFGKNGVFDGNPAAGTGGWALPSGTVYPLFVTRHIDQATLNASPSGKPSGFGNLP